MDHKTLQILDYIKILERLGEHCAFPVSRQKALELRPTADLFEARRRMDETSEAVNLLVTQADITIGGARDVREPVDLALHGGVLDPADLLDIKYTLIAARDLARRFERLRESYPMLADIAAQLPSGGQNDSPMGIIDAVSRAISERGDILDSASDKLGRIRRDLRIVHDRLLSKLQRIISDSRNASYLQEALITQRDGRYVIPLRAEFKGRIRSIVHDQSASGATIFVEPVSVVEQNNQYRELQLAERDEERRILAELSRSVGQYAYEINHTVDVVAELDLAFARAKLAESMKASELKLHPIEGKKNGETGTNSKHRHPGSLIRLFQARHPLLDPETVVAIDIELDANTYALVITGPNTGGKTVTLKTVGLLALMAQSGLHIPVHSGSELSLFENIYADIGDEQSIEQSLSTFSGHITNIIRILEQANSNSLVILDELGAGTDPQEGAALARALLNHLLDRSITTLVTTHHPELKAFAHATPGVVNGSVEFDLESLQPTFHLTIGLPGRSNALAIARRLGLPKPIVNNARSELDPNDVRAEDLLNEIHRQRDLSRQARIAAENARQKAESLSADLAARLEQIEDERRSILEQARLEAQKQIDDIKKELEAARKTLDRARQPIAILDEIKEKIEKIQEDHAEPIERRRPEFDAAIQELKPKSREIRLGDKVRLRNLGTKGVVSAISENEAEIQVGVMRVSTRLTDLELVSSTSDSEKQDELGLKRKHSSPADPATKIPVTESPGIELDLRGKRGDEAEIELERYLDAAFSAGLPFVRVIHGKGTGKLRQVVRTALQNHPHISSFESGKIKEGGDGVTVAKLRI
jgi:DNA mismatch repair protein MutS2